MLFNKPLVLDCYTVSPDAFVHSKPDYANKFIPKWFKNVKPPCHTAKSLVEEGFFPNIKGCAGFIEYFKTGFMLPCWSDLALQIGPRGTNDYRYQFSDQASCIEPHPLWQVGDYFSETEVQHMKICSPWRISASKDIKFLFVKPAWQYDTIKDSSFDVLSGVVNFKYQHHTNVNIFIHRRDEEQNILIPHGQPLLHMIPITNKKIKFRYHLVTTDSIAWRKLSIEGLKFSNRYFHSRRIQERNEHDRKKS